ncbi:MAG TPA: efflux RND transporter permease subunit [Vicinamibacterales bacterium]|jgi:multidrug efflux pump subunit AcrB|nr:efflux RND transporter permease subunit [Vicinamibacterales bacterium]
MWLIRAALRRPITVLVAVIAVALTAWFAVTRMRADIFPDLDLPVIYVAQPYGGMSPAQMEGYITYYYEYHFLYINGIESVESKSIQNTSLLKLTFHRGTDMGEALAQTIGYVNRARAFMPPGTVGAFVMRFDAGTVPVGYLVFRSETRSLGEIQDLALNRVRPQFATLPGLTSPPPFGGSQRTIVIRVDPDRLRSYGMAADDVIRAVSTGNVIMPSGSVNIGEETRISPLNSVVGTIDDLLQLPIRTGAGPPVSIRDVGSVSDSTDIPTAYALVNGRRAVYIPVTKRPDASTLDVVREVRANLGRFQALVPDDIKVSYELDQSVNVSAALASVLREALLGSLLTGLMVLLFLRSWRSSAIVVVTIPFALLTAVVALWGAGHTINIMTLGGLTLAVGILVDEATVTIENIHTHVARGTPAPRAVLDASAEVIVPRLLAMLSVVAVFVPSFFMTGIARTLFVPLSLAVGFSMIASFFLSSSLVPVLAVWWLGPRGGVTPAAAADPDWIDRLRHHLAALLQRLASHRGLLAAAYALVAVAIAVGVGGTLGRELFPPSGVKAFQLRFRAPAGTKFESTERLGREVLDAIRETAGAEHVDITLGYVGVQPSSYPINTIFLWTGGSHEGVLQVALRQDAPLRLDALEERLRDVFHRKFPDAQFSFEPGDIVSRIMNFSAPTPVEVAVMGPDFAASRAFATRIQAQLAAVPSLRDLQFGQALDYPAIEVNVDRQVAGQLGVTVDQVGRSFAAATSSSRFVSPNYWADPRSGIAFQVQVEVPQPQMTTLEDLRVVPVSSGGPGTPLLGDLARIENATIVGEYDRINGLRMVTLTANVAGEDLGRAAGRVTDAIRRAGVPPRGTTVAVRGQVTAMAETFANVTTGLAVAVVVIFLLLAATFQSLRLAFVVVSTVPAVLAGVAVMLWATGTTLNVQSFIGAIMAIGVAVANAILLVTFAEQGRRNQVPSLQAAIDAARARLRPVLMTSAAMIAGMIPMALAFGEGAEATAPLGRAVIGGLSMATIATLIVLPSIYSLVQQSARVTSRSLDPDDPGSAFGMQAGQ